MEKATAGDSYGKAQLLSQRQKLCPSITGGFLWEVLPHTLIYDAPTTGGSSGGPVLDRQGRVIGINAAYLSGFRGINYGVPIRFAQELLRGRGQEVDGPTRETPETKGSHQLSLLFAKYRLNWLRSQLLAASMDENYDSRFWICCWNHSQA
ncbi:MAG: serine protease [Deltaproteobacteria bacterium]|nr:serine protease [Deltaproteobacteria bacterium]